MMDRESLIYFAEKDGMMISLLLAIFYLLGAFFLFQVTWLASLVFLVIGFLELRRINNKYDKFIKRLKRGRFLWK